MAGTDPASIQTALETVIEALTPEGGTTVGERNAFEKINVEEYFEVEDLVAESELDRGYALHGIIPDVVNIVQGKTVDLLEGHFTLAVGHEISASYVESRNRRDKDIHQLLMQVTKHSNLPSNVWKIRHSSTSKPRVLQRDEQFYWWTEITYTIKYSIDSNYGG